MARVSCGCGQVSFDANGTPIARAICYCASCRTAGIGFAQAPGAPSIVGADGGTDMTLYRKDRIGPMSGGALLHEHRLNPESPTRRVVASCCNTPLFADFTKGHWLSVYTGSLAGEIAPLDMRVMTADRPAGPALPDDVPQHPKFPPRFMLKMLAAWMAMGFRRPKLRW
jgi:hypothetical protein